MIKNYFRIIYRNLFRQGVYSYINIIGLAVSIACFMLVSGWVLNELNYDTFLSNHENIYRVNTVIKGKGTSVLSVDYLSSALKEQFPEVVNSCRVNLFARDITIKYGDRVFSESGEILADPNFFQFFSFELIKGRKENVLDAPDKYVISESAARKIFGSEDPIGKVVIINPAGRKREVMISGVAKDLPGNSHIRFNFVTALGPLPYWGDGWTFLVPVTYIRLSDKVSAAAFEKKISGFIKKYKNDTPFTLKLQRLTDIHLNSSSLLDAAAVSEPGSSSQVAAFAVIAVLILLLSSVNFVNLSIAGSFKKTKEAGIRKIIGAPRWQLILQFLGESFFTVLISAGLAAAIMEIVYPLYNNLTGTDIKFSMADPGFIRSFLLIILFVGFISGAYPAFYITSCRTVKIIKGASLEDPAGKRIKRALVIFQFALSIGMIAAALIINQQLRFIMSKNPGFSKEQVIFFNGHDMPFNPKDELLKIPSVKSVAWSSELPFSVNYFMEGAEWEGKKDDNIRMRYLMVDYDFLKTYDIKLKEGRDFSKEYSTDKYAYLLNETAVKMMGLKNPVGRDIVCLTAFREPIPGKIIGVVKDFHFNTFHNKIEPLVMGAYFGKPWYISVKVNSSGITNTIARIENMIHRESPDYVFDYKFVDQAFEKQYTEEIRMGKIFTGFSLLSIILSCLGLFGLTAITVEQSTKQLAVRKVLGASAFNIIFYLVKRYLTWMLTAFIIAAPVTYYFMNIWLLDFAYKTGLNLWLFVFGGLITLAVALITISSLAIKAAKANPVDSLKYE